MIPKTAGAYISGLFDKVKGWQGDQIQSEMLASTMTDYIFWSIHVQPNGDLHMNDVPVCVGGLPNTSVTSHLRSFISAAKAHGATIWFSVGSGGVPDYAHIASILANPSGSAYANLFANLYVLNALGADGYDFDYEESFYPSGPGVDVITKFGIALHDQYNAKLTYCPYTDHSFWVQCLQAMYSHYGYQPVAALRLQGYSGVGDYDPTTWATSINNAGVATTGISDGLAFMRLGLAVAGGTSGPAYDPTDMQSKIAGYGVPGGWIWNAEQVVKNQGTTGFSIADYASAILAGDA